MGERSPLAAERLLVGLRAKCQQALRSSFVRGVRNTIDCTYGYFLLISVESVGMGLRPYDLANRRGGDGALEVGLARASHASFEPLPRQVDGACSAA
jgi:hypothetical protein